MATVHIGTSSWYFETWRGVFYPEKLPKRESLAYYATRFNTVEVNTSFYALPKPTSLIQWVESVPEGFTFALKFPKAISHEKMLTDCRPETLAFLDVLRALGEHGAPAFLQLPPKFTRQYHGRTLANFLDWLAEEKTDLHVAVEVRAPDLMTSAFAKFVAERDMALVLVARQNTPDLFTHWMALVESNTAPAYAFIRWIGDDRNGPKGNREISAPRDEELALWARRIAQLHQANIDVYGYMHNPFEGHSPASVRRLLARVTDIVTLPEWLPEPARATTGQMSLFEPNS